jgi:hypothetical protein
MRGTLALFALLALSAAAGARASSAAEEPARPAARVYRYSPGGALRADSLRAISCSWTSRAACS